MFNTPAGAASGVLLPASVTVSATASPNSSGNAGTISLGAYDAVRVTIVTAAPRTDTTSGNVTVTLGGVSMTNIVNQFAASGSNPSAVLILDTGVGSAFEDLTTAALVVTGPGTIQRAGICVLRALNLSTLTAHHTNSNTNQNGTMGINKVVDGIAISAGYDGVNASNPWIGMDVTQDVGIGTSGVNPTGYEDTDADETPASINITTLVTSSQRGWVAASWRGASNP